MYLIWGKVEADIAHFNPLKMLGPFALWHVAIDGRGVFTHIGGQSVAQLRAGSHGGRAVLLRIVKLMRLLGLTILALKWEQEDEFKAILDHIADSGQPELFETQSKNTGTQP